MHGSGIVPQKQVALRDECAHGPPAEPAHEVHHEGAGGREEGHFKRFSGLTVFGVRPAQQEDDRLVGLGEPVGDACPPFRCPPFGGQAHAGVRPAAHMDSNISTFALPIACFGRQHPRRLNPVGF